MIAGRTIVDDRRRLTTGLTTRLTMRGRPADEPVHPSRAHDQDIP
jgi:hypothetical protein